MRHLASVTAYIDAGSGSLIASAIVGGAASIGVFCKMFGRRFVSLFSATKREELRAGRAAAAPATDGDTA